MEWGLMTAPPGNPKGVLSTMLKVRCEYAGGTESAGPRTMVVKLCPTDFGARTLGRLCFFESEVRAYERDLFGIAGLQTPRCYHARFDRVSGESVLFLEDMAPLGTRPQLEGYTLAESKATLAEISKLHATFHRATGAPGLEAHPALQGWPFCVFGDPMIQDVVAGPPRHPMQALNPCSGLETSLW
jgi:hypothetical protein